MLSLSTYKKCWSFLDDEGKFVWLFLVDHFIISRHYNFQDWAPQIFRWTRHLWLSRCWKYQALTTLIRREEFVKVCNVHEGVILLSRLMRKSFERVADFFATPSPSYWMDIFLAPTRRSNKYFAINPINFFFATDI